MNKLRINDLKCDDEKQNIVKKYQFLGVGALNRKFKISQLADDTVMFLKDKNWVNKGIGEFSAVSGLRMNLNKSVLFPIKKCDLVQLDNIPVKNSPTYLVSVIGKNAKIHCDLNYNPIICG